MTLAPSARVPRDDADTIPGDPAVLLATAATLRRAATMLLTARDAVAGVQADGWIGSEGDRYRELLADYPAPLATASSSMTQASRAVTEFADVLASAQARYREARMQVAGVAAEVEQARAGAEFFGSLSGAPGLGEAIARGRLQAAQDRCAAIRAEVAQAAQLAARTLEQASPALVVPGAVVDCRAGAPDRIMGSTSHGLRVAGGAMGVGQAGITIEQAVRADGRVEVTVSDERAAYVGGGFGATVDASWDDRTWVAGGQVGGQIGVQGGIEAVAVVPADEVDDLVRRLAPAVLFAGRLPTQWHGMLHAAGAESVWRSQGLQGDLEATAGAVTLGGAVALGGAGVARTGRHRDGGVTRSVSLAAQESAEAMVMSTPGIAGAISRHDKAGRVELSVHTSKTGEVSATLTQQRQVAGPDGVRERTTTRRTTRVTQGQLDAAERALESAARGDTDATARDVGVVSDGFGPDGDVDHETRVLDAQRYGAGVDGALGLKGSAEFEIATEQSRLTELNGRRCVG